MVKVEINGTTFEAEEGTTLLELADANKIDIPTLCHSKALDAYGACRLCVVELLYDGWSKLATACTLPVKDGLRVATDSEKVMKSRKMTVELMLARCPEEQVLLDLAKEYDLGTPRFKEKDDNCILCGLCVRMCERMGVNAIDFQGRGIDRELGTPYMELSDVCVTCGACAFICPTTRFTEKKVERISGNRPITILSEFDEGVGTRHPNYISFPQAIPKIPVIDQERCVYYQTGHCKICEEFCEADAIVYDQETETKEFEVGSIIVSTGFKPFDPTESPQYGYGRFKNVITSLEFERILNASGPTGGHIIRPLDHKEPKKVAFIQCVGSRDCHTNEYCSSVCCTYAIKEAIIAREHSPELEATIFAMDTRTFGRGFEDYLTRAKDEYGIKILNNSRIPAIEEVGDGNLLIKFMEDDKIMEEEYDMVILSIGLEPAEGTVELAEKLGIDLNEHGFCDTKLFDPLSTSNPGVFVCGAISGPKDIPETVAQASGAAEKASSIIASERNTLVTEKEYPEETDVSGQEPRIGVLVCHCGTNIGGVVDVPAVVEYVKTLPNVVFAADNLYSCSQDSQVMIRDLIREHDLNRLVVASCSPRTHEPLFQASIREGGLNPYLFEMANIRDQCSWVHMREPEKATEKSKELASMAVAKAALLQPLQSSLSEVTPTALIIGGGLAGMTAALELSKQGFKTDVIERSDALGGHLNGLMDTITGDDPKALLEDLVSQVNDDNNITVHLSTELDNLDGYLGNFTSTLTDGTAIEHGVLIVSTGGVEHSPKEYSYGRHPNIMTQLEFEKGLHEGKVKPKSVAIIHCVGARNEENTECGRICCTTSIKIALNVRKNFPETTVYNLYRDIRTYGFKEKYYQEAGETGVTFIQYDDDKKPEVLVNGDSIELRVMDHILGRELVLNPDYLVLSAAVVADGSNEELAKKLKVPLGKDGFFLEAHVKLRPLDFATEGIYVCGMAQGPKFIDETISQACGAVARACTILSKETVVAGGMVSVVDEDACGGCGTCEAICPYGAIAVDMTDLTDLKAKVNDILCKGCGSCAAACPECAISIKHFTDQQILAQIKALSKEVSQ